MSTDMLPTRDLLADILVIDCSTGTMGPYCGRILAELGARVIKVEPPAGDPGRAMGPFLADLPGPERSGLFAFLNTGKRGVTIDYRSRAGRHQLLSLLGSADVLVESFGPRGLQDAAVAPVDALALNPRLVIASLSPFGATGPYRDRPSSELTLLATAGWLNQVGEEGRAPLKTTGRMSGMTAPALIAAYAILAALRMREASGVGQQIDIGAMESMLAASRYFETTYEYFGHEVKRLGAHEIYECLDGYVTLSPGVSGKWDMFFALIGQPELMDDPRRREFGNAKELMREYEQIVGQWVKDKTRDEIFHRAQEFGIVAAPILSIDEVPQLPPLRERSAFTTFAHPIIGRYLAPGAAFLVNGSGWVAPSAPTLGQDNDEILSVPPSSLERWDADVRATVDPHSRSRSGSATALPLAGIRVLDVTTFWAGPLAGALLADLGAEVIKVEAIQRPDGWRSLFVDRHSERPWETGCCYNSANRNKLGITLNLGCPEGVDLFRQLVGVSDVMVENFSPRMWGNLGLTYDVLADINPPLILASVNGFGAQTSWRNYVSVGSTAEGLSGLASITGYKGEEPLKHGTWLSDPLASLNAAVGILAALHARARTGKGAWIDVSQIDVTLPVVADAFMDWALNGRVQGRSGNADPERSPSGTYRCAGDNRWLAVCIETQAQWRAMASLLGRPDWGDLQWEARLAIADKIDGAINDWASSQDRDEAVGMLLARGIDVGPVMTPPDLLHDPHLQARGFFERVERRFVGIHPYAGVVPKFSETPCHIRKPAPTLGEDNAYVFRNILKLSQEQVEALESRGVIGDVPLFARQGTPST